MCHWTQSKAKIFWYCLDHPVSRNVGHSAGRYLQVPLGVIGVVGLYSLARDVTCGEVVASLVGCKLLILRCYRVRLSTPEGVWTRYDLSSPFSCWPLNFCMTTASWVVGDLTHTGAQGESEHGVFCRSNSFVESCHACQPA